MGLSHEIIRKHNPCPLQDECLPDLGSSPRPLLHVWLLLLSDFVYARATLFSWIPHVLSARSLWSDRCRKTCWQFY